MAHTLDELSDEAWEYLSAYHLGTLTTLRRDGSPHVVAVGYTVDAGAGLVRVITRRGSQKAANARRGGRAVVAGVDGPRWLALEGEVGLLESPEEVREAERRYAERYRTPTPNPERVVLTIAVDRVLGSTVMFSPRD